MKDNIDKQLLNFIQAKIELVPQPYRALGDMLGITEEDVISRIKELKAKGIIRQISPVFDPRRLGYTSTLVAMEAPKDKVEKAEQVLIDHSGVSHGYERDHKFNIWFTLAIPPDKEADDELREISESTGVETVMSLPATRLFKIGTYFAADGEVQTGNTAATFDGRLPQRALFSPSEKIVINGLQRDLPLISRPFAQIAERRRLSEKLLLNNAEVLLELGIMRRFSAQVNHRRVGYTANGMTCWIVPPEKVDEVGKKIAALPEVSHCYERMTNASWPYNLFAMIHARDEETCNQIAVKASKDGGLSGFKVLFSTKEFKKTRIRYPV